MSNFELQSKYCEVLINEVLDINSFSIDSIKEWYEHCKLYHIGTWFNFLEIPTNIEVDNEYEKIFNIVENGLRDKTYQMFKNMYEGERMLGMLKDYTYTSKDSHTVDMIRAELNQTCNWLIELCIYCIKYHLIRALHEEFYDLCEHDISDDRILKIMEIKLHQIESFDMRMYDSTLIGYDNKILEFVKLYVSGQFIKMPLSQKLVIINEFKDIAHYNGTLLQGTDPFYIFDEDHKDMYDSITQLNDRAIERKLKRIVGY